MDLILFQNYKAIGFSASSVPYRDPVVMPEGGSVENKEAMKTAKGL